MIEQCVCESLCVFVCLCVCVCALRHVSMADLCPQVIDYKQAFIRNGPYICLSVSAGEWDHKETYTDQTQKGPLHTASSILAPEKLLFFLSQGRDLLATQLETAGAIDEPLKRFAQLEFSSRIHFDLSLFIMYIFIIHD